MDPRLRSLSKKEEKQPMDSIPTLMGLNGLIYKVPMDSSLSVQRNLQTFNFDSTSYTNASPSMSVNFQAGSGFINCATSYVSLELKVDSKTNASDYSFGIGSASNIFRTNIVTTRSGAEVDRFQNANVLLPQLHKGKNPSEWFKSVGALAGYGALNAAGNSRVTGTAYQYVIPLSHFAGIFSSKQLMPSQLASGMRLDCQLESALTAITTADTDVTYTITNPKLVLDVSILSDGALAQLTQQAGKNGLEYSFSTYANESSTTTTASVNVQFSRSVARALRCYVVPRPSNNVGAQAADSFATGVVPYSRVQFQIGSTYFPNREIQNNAQVYANLLQTLGQFSGHAFGDLTKEDFDAKGFAVASSAFETSALIRASGTSVNNSRSLLINLTADILSRDIQSYLEYQVILRANLANVNVTS
jgi:hypothetical protein